MHVIANVQPIERDHTHVFRRNRELGASRYRCLEGRETVGARLKLVFVENELIVEMQLTNGRQYVYVPVADVNARVDSVDCVVSRVANDVNPGAGQPQGGRVDGGGSRSGGDCGRLVYGGALSHERASVGTLLHDRGEVEDDRAILVVGKDAIGGVGVGLVDGFDFARYELGLALRALRLLRLGLALLTPLLHRLLALGELGRRRVLALFVEMAARVVRGAVRAHGAEAHACLPGRGCRPRLTARCRASRRALARVELTREEGAAGLDALDLGLVLLVLQDDRRGLRHQRDGVVDSRVLALGERLRLDGVHLDLHLHLDGGAQVAHPLLEDVRLLRVVWLTRGWQRVGPRLVDVHHVEELLQRRLVEAGAHDQVDPALDGGLARHRELVVRDFLHHEHDEVASTRAPVGGALASPYLDESLVVDVLEEELKHVIVHFFAQIGGDDVRGRCVAEFPLQKRWRAPGGGGRARVCCGWRCRGRCPWIAAVRGRRCWRRRDARRGSGGWHPHAGLLGGARQLPIAMSFCVLHRVDGNLPFVRDGNACGYAEQLEAEGFLKLVELFEEPRGSLNLAAVPDVC